MIFADSGAGAGGTTAIALTAMGLGATILKALQAMYAKRNGDRRIGSISVHEWHNSAQEMIKDALDDKLVPALHDLRESFGRLADEQRRQNEILLKYVSRLR